jgi:hypothetical protein
LRRYHRNVIFCLPKAKRLMGLVIEKGRKGMGRNVRLGLLACAGLTTLTFTAFASAERLGVSSTPSSGVVIHYSQPASAAAPAKVTIYPNPSYLAGTQVENLSQAPGTTIGTASAKAVAGALGGATLPLTGSIVVKGAGDTYMSNGSPVTFAAAATACTGTATHTTFWDLQLTAAGQSLEVPVFVDKVPTTLGTDPTTGAPIANPEASATTGWGAAEIKVCLPSPDVPPPAGAAFGAHLFDATLAIKGVWSGGSNEYRWRALVIPYTAGTATPDPAHAVEVQGLERRFGFVSARAKYAGLTAKVTGVVTEAGTSVDGATVTITGGRRAVKVKSNATGDFSAKVLLRTKGAVLKATAVVPERDLGSGACSVTPAFVTAIPTVKCADVSVGGWTLSVRVRKAR